MNLAQYWLDRIARESPEQNQTTRNSIIKWLFDDTGSVDSGTKIVEYRWKILRQSYLNTTPDKSYTNLMQRLLTIIFSRREVETVLSPNREQLLIAIAILEKILKDLLTYDSHIQKKMIAIANFTPDKYLRNALLFATLEEYCLQPLQNQILLIYLFNNHLQTFDQTHHHHVIT